MRTNSKACITLTLALPFVLPACAPEQDCTDVCGTMITLTTAGVDAIVPAFTGSSNGYAIGDQMFLKLAEIGPDLEPIGDAGFIPELAERWSFEDPRTIVFYLDPRAAWHDAVPVTAEDVVFTFDVYRDTLVNAVPRDNLEPIASVTARDDHTIVFTFEEEYTAQFYDATHHMRILPAHLLNTVPRAELRSHPFTRAPIGNGPYRFASWTTGESVELVADPEFFLGTPGIGRLIWQIVGDLQAAVERMLAGDADFLDFLGTPENAERVRAAPNLEVATFPASFYYYIAFNFDDPDRPGQPHPLFSDPVVRRAITMAVDREAINAAVFGEYGEVPPGPISRGLWIWDDERSPLPYDTTEAKRLLASRGWEDRDGDGVLDSDAGAMQFELTSRSSSSSSRAAAVILQEQLRRVGIEVTFTDLEFLTWQTRGQAGRFDATFGAWIQDPDPSGLLQTWASGGGSNWGGYRSPRFDELIAQAIAAREREVARDLWDRAMETIQNDAPAIWMMTLQQAAAVSSRFENVAIRPDQWSAYLWTWRVRRGEMIERDMIGAR
jgi:peptide/nickel transport system substrate-binding protein